MAKNGEETPAEARRRRLAESLRANLRRRKERDRQRAEPDRADTPREADGRTDGEPD